MSQSKHTQALALISICMGIILALLVTILPIWQVGKIALHSVHTINLRLTLHNAQSNQCAYLHTCLLAYMCIIAYLPTYILAYMHTCILAYLHTCILSYLHTCILAYLHNCILAYLVIRFRIQNLTKIR